MESLCKGGEPHGCGERLKGPWMALVSRPLEQRCSERTPRVARGRMQGQSVFGYFFPGRAGASGKSDSPSRAKQDLSPPFKKRLWRAARFENRSYQLNPTPKIPAKSHLPPVSTLSEPNLRSCQLRAAATPKLSTPSPRLKRLLIAPENFGLVFSTFSS